MELEALTAGMRVAGLIPGEAVTVVAVTSRGPDAVSLVLQTDDGHPIVQLLYRPDAESVEPVVADVRPFDADGADFKLAAEAQRIQLAGLFDPMLAVTTSSVQPLPHQLRAVYEHLLPRTPLRFLLADDPGAGKTVMAGLYLKELLLRRDVERCLVVAPGGLVDQWQDELFFKFGLRFEILARKADEAGIGASVFERHRLLIARMDQLSRDDELLAELEASEWDLVVVDEAHRMSAHYFGGKLNKTRRFALGELLARRTRHLLLMTATPHSGSEEDFQLFLTLLDPEGFEGRYRAGVHTADTSDLMLRRVKEDLLTFEGRPLFPDRIAETVAYELSPAEQALYELVTDYVRDGMNRAERLDGARRNTVGFALTVLQRRLASSPEAIHQSLLRRSARLRKRRLAMASGDFGADVVLEVPDTEELDAEQAEQLEEELVDAATAARTLAELDAELAELDLLIAEAAKVVNSGADVKWTQLRTILEENVLGAGGQPRKLIVFSEHRDTLNYLLRRIANVMGRADAVVAIHGGVSRLARRQITEEFTKNPRCQIMVATDAAGEGLNLQAAHLMVNYDLPWNPNRIEQRFGRVHRIGQSEVCRLWNLVAEGTREGAVFRRLLDKIEEQRRAYAGRVFDVLGQQFPERSLRELLLDAIRHGERPDVRARMHQVIDEHVADGLREVIEERALAQQALSEADLAGLRRSMELARARRLQPHYVEMAFRKAFTRLGGRMARREAARFEISNVPAALRAPMVATRYERVTFELDGIDGPPVADLLAPGHPLHDAVMEAVIRRHGGTLDRGAVLVSGTISEPSLLVGVLEEVGDATGEPFGKRFGYALVNAAGDVRDAGPAPYLDCVPGAGPLRDRFASLPWLAAAEERVISWAVGEDLPAYLADLRARRRVEVERTRSRVRQRLNGEINRIAGDALVAEEKERRGEAVKVGSETLNRRVAELDVRLTRRLAELDRQALLSTREPRVVCAALVVPLTDAEAAVPSDSPIRAVETKQVERRGVDLVLASERALGRTPTEQAFNNPGFDVLSDTPDGELVWIEVKARLAGSEDFWITHNEVLHGRNTAPRYRLALVSVDPRGAEFDRVCYVDDPFRGFDLGDFDAVGVRGDWAKTWARGREPF